MRLDRPSDLQGCYFVFVAPGLFCLEEEEEEEKKKMPGFQSHLTCNKEGVI
jgi:hypothetical protein